MQRPPSDARDNSGMPAHPPDEPEVPDTVERFVTDLRSLYQEHPGRYTLKRLHSETGLSSSRFGAAIKNTDTLPSADTVEAMVRILDPGHAAPWVERRHRLARPVAGGSNTAAPSTLFLPPHEPEADPTVPPGGDSDAEVKRDDPTPKRPQRPPWSRGRWVSAAVALAAILGGLLTTPFELGGVNTVAFCLANYPRSDARSGQVAIGGTWNDWRCQLDDANHTEIPIDFQLACRQQYPALGPFGGAQFAAHKNAGFISWRCYGSVVHGW